MSKKAERVINGTHGAIWINGQKLAELDTFEAKITLEYEDVRFAEDTGTYRKFMGWTGEGSIGLKKVFSRGALLLGQAVKNGRMPEIEITTKLADPGSYGVERTSLSSVTFNEFLLAKLGQRELLTEELSFAFGDFDLLEMIKVQENIAS